MKGPVLQALGRESVPESSNADAHMTRPGGLGSKRPSPSSSSESEENEVLLSSPVGLPSGTAPQK